MKVSEKPLTRAQRIFVVELALQSALDRIETALPTAGLVWQDRLNATAGAESKSFALGPYEQGAIEAVGMFLAAFYAQQTGEGCGIQDALECAGDFEEKCADLVAYAWRSERRGTLKKMARTDKEIYGRRWPNVRRCAVTFVNTAFGEES